MTHELPDEPPAEPTDAPIGVFDSGMGGLTVLQALERELPGATFIYLGDTARLPYGTKSPATVRRYALRASAELVRRGVGALVVACNTASAVALDALQEAYRDIPVFGVVEPGAAAACALPSVRRVAVLATESTVRGGAYASALLQRNPHLEIRSRPAPLLVTLAEEGWLVGDVPDAVLRAYLSDWLSWRPDCLLLGCTHFPVFRARLMTMMGAEVEIVDSATTTARAVACALADVPDAFKGASSGSSVSTRRMLLATDDASRFVRVGRHFIDGKVGEIEVVDI